MGEWAQPQLHRVLVSELCPSLLTTNKTSRTKNNEFAENTQIKEDNKNKENKGSKENKENKESKDNEEQSKRTNLAF